MATAADLNGTAGGGHPVRGHTFVQGQQQVTLEVDGGLTCVVTVAPGDAVEWMPVSTSDAPLGVWTLQVAGTSWTVNAGQRVAIRPRGSSSVLFAWTGEERLAKLQAYSGRKGQDSGG